MGVEYDDNITLVGKPASGGSITPKASSPSITKVPKPSSVIGKVEKPLSEPLALLTEDSNIITLQNDAILKVEGVV